MTDDKNLSTRETPPEGKEDYRRIWDSADKAQKSWVIVAPIFAFVQNWKAVVAVVVFVVWINRPEILDALGTLIGASK